MLDGTSTGPGATVILNSKLNSFTSKLGTTTIVGCTSVPSFPISATPKRGNEFVFTGVTDRRYILVRNEIRLCRNCATTRATIPVELVQLVKTRGLVLAGTTNKVGGGLGPNSFVVVRSRVSDFIPSPLANGGSRSLNIHFPSVDGICSGRLVGLVGSTTTRYKVGVGGNICVRLNNPTFRAGTRVGVYSVLNTSTINVDATARTRTTGRYNFEIYNVDYVAGLTYNLHSIPVASRRMGRANTEATGSFTILVAALARGVRGKWCGLQGQRPWGA